VSVMVRVAAVCLLLCLILAASLLAGPGDFSPVDSALLQDNLYAGGFMGSPLSPSPAAVVVNGSGAVVYTWGFSGMIVSTRASSRGVVMSGFIRGRGGSSGLVVALQGKDARSFSVVGDADVYVSDGFLEGDVLVVAGYFYRRGSRDADVFVAKIGLNGSILGAKCFGSRDYPDTARRIIAGEGGYYVVGDTWAYNVSQSDVLLLSLGMDLSLRESFSVGGASLETGEDFVLMPNGDYVVIGTTESEGVAQGFAARVSRVGGLLWLRGYRTLGDTFLKRAWLDPTTGKVYVAGAGVFDEEQGREPFVLVLDEVWGWSFNESGLVIVRAEPSQSLSGVISDGRVILHRSGGLTVLSLSGLAFDYAVSPPTLNGTYILDDSGELPYYARSFYGWRVLRGVVSERACPHLTVEEVNASASTLSIETREIQASRKPFERRFNLELAVRRFVERNVPIFLLMPVAIALLAVVYFALRSVLPRSPA